MVLLGHGENSIYHIEMELRTKYKEQAEFVTEIADIQDRNKIFEIMKNTSLLLYTMQLHINTFH